jgi:tetratricopeptide (TPR) repeat protein
MFDPELIDILLDFLGKSVVLRVQIKIGEIFLGEIFKQYPELEQRLEYLVGLLTQTALSVIPNLEDQREAIIHNPELLNKYTQVLFEKAKLNEEIKRNTSAFLSKMPDQGLLNYCRYLKEQALFIEAEKNYEGYRNKFKNDPFKYSVWLLDLGTLYTSKGEFDKAEENLRESLKLAYKVPSEKFLELNEDRNIFIANVRVSIADLYYEKKEYGNAIQEFQELLYPLNNSDKYIYLNKSIRVYLSNNQIDKVEELLDTIGDNLGNEYPSRHHILLLRNWADYLFKKGLDNQAELKYLEVIDEINKDSEFAKLEYVRNLHVVGNFYRDKKDFNFDQADQLLNKALEYSKSIFIFNSHHPMISNIERDLNILEDKLKHFKSQ